LFTLHRHGHAGRNSDYINGSASVKNGLVKIHTEVHVYDLAFRGVHAFQVLQHHKITPLSILGCDQQNMGKILLDFKWAGHRLAHIFADGWSTASHKRKMTLLEAPTGTLLFNYKNIKQEIVHTLLLEKYGVSMKWVIIMDRRQDSNVTSTPAGKSGPSAQDRYRAKGLVGGAKKLRANEEE